jgi:outer membrane protein assembly factor BamB
MRSELTPALVVCTVALLVPGPARAVSGRAGNILEAAEIKGGLVVHLGCGDGTLTTALHAGDGYVVHGLDVRPEEVKKAREYIRSQGLYGPVSVEHFTGTTLPYVDNLVNLVVISHQSSVTGEEIERVLAPRGVAVMPKQMRLDDSRLSPLATRHSPLGEDWLAFRKPVPGDIDEWTHYLHGPDNNAVADDRVVGPPRHLQWTGGPRWARHHEHLSSMNAMVSAGGRVFYVMDEGSRASIQLPPKWKLIARDAFNGTILWKRDLPRWYVHNYPLKSGPADLPRRLVAAGERVYLPLGIDQPLSVLDAATGRTLQTYGPSRAAEEVLLTDGILLVVANPDVPKVDRFEWDEPICWWVNYKAIHARAWQGKKRTLLAMKADTGEVLWQVRDSVAPVTLAAAGRHAVYHDGDKVICLDRASGQKRWESESLGVLDSRFPTQFASTLVLAGNVVLFAGGDRKMTALAAADGKTLWQSPHYKAGHMSPEDILVVGGLAWTGGLADRKKNNVWTGYDLQTGEVKKEFPPDIKSYWFHHRCHKSKATVDYLLPSRTGIEFVDWRKETWQRNHWVRGACLYGIMPCNGLVYAPQHPCACYVETKLNGLNALAPASAKATAGEPARPAKEAVEESARLERGGAYGTPNRQLAIGNPQSGDWPTYRGDNRRQGTVSTKVGAGLNEDWKANVGGRLSAVTVADGACFVSDIDRHTVHALDSASGGALWSFTAGARVDSPPTISRGSVFFGCNDGFVYCLRADDGELIWRYLAAPGRDRVTAMGQVESAWPVHGSVLVQDGSVYCVAGRSAFLDGGMRFCRLDAATGQLLSESTIDDRLPESGDDLQTKMRGLDMPVALPDVLSSDGERIYMRSQPFDLEGKRTSVAAPHDAADQVGPEAHLFCGAGMLDGSWFHRAYWLYGRQTKSGCNYWFHAGRYAPSGRILAVDGDMVYGYGRQPHYFIWTPALEYRLFAVNRHVTPEGVERVKAGNKKLDKRNTKGPWFESDRWIFNRDATSKLKTRELSAADERWVINGPEVIARAIVVTDDLLFVAGPPDLLDEEAAVRRRYDGDVQKQLVEQDAALSGARGGLLWALSKDDGTRRKQVRLDAMPVWDGMAAADGRLYLSLADGSIRCFAAD